MASANSALQISNLDFPSIKSSLKAFLQQQDTLKDYNFDGSALSVLVDLLAYNTQYNAYYVNMAANEMFLDSSIQRNSVVSHAKLLNYTPKSSSAPVAKINLNVYQVGTQSLTLPKYTQLLSEAIDGVNYKFVTADIKTASVTSNTATFNDVTIVQGTPAAQSYTVDKTANPKLLYPIPDANIDTSYLTVSVQESNSNTQSEVYTLATDYAGLSPTSKVFFLQEGISGLYEIYFGDGILGKTLNNGNVVNIEYLTTQGTSSFGANSFVLMSSIGGHSNTLITSVSAATMGKERESIDSIKYTAPKSYSAQGRAVTKEDYIYLIQNNSTNIPLESVSVWGGEENTPPVYGQIFCAIKPAGGYTLTPSQKQKIISEVIRPISVLTVQPTIIDPDYNYIRVSSNVLYDSRKTKLTARELQDEIIAGVRDFSARTLNTFNSIFNLPDLIANIQSSDNSIITSDTSIKIQKKFYPSLTTKTTYELNFGVPLKRNFYNAGITSYPGVSMRDTTAANVTRTGVFFEEVPTTVGGISSINITNQGFNYTKTPTVTIVGDGTGAKATAKLSATRVISITVTDPGINYTQATVVITPDPTDKSGNFASAVAVLEGAKGVLRTYYYLNNVKTILNYNAGTVDYYTGQIILTDFSPVAIDNELGQLVISAVPDTTIISSTFNKIITVDEFDPDSVVVTAIASQ